MKPFIQSASSTIGFNRPKGHLFMIMKVSKAIHFMRSGVWRIPESELSRPKSFFIRQLRVIILAFRGLVEDRCQLKASALAFYSLLSVVPVLALIFGISKGFGFEKAIENVILEKLEGQKEVAIRIVKFAHMLLDNTEGGLIAGIGIIILFLVIILILSDIENAINDIWGIKKSRSLGRKISDYLSLMLICPVLITMSGTMTVVITSGVKLVVQKIALLGSVSPAIFFLLNLMPYFVLWILFTFLYIFLPNTRINFRSGALGGIIAGSIYQIFQWTYINFQILVTRYNAIYGSFAALPLFFIWLQLSWLILLLGAEISFASQNADKYEFENDCQRVSHSFKRLMSLRIMHLLVKGFSNARETWDAASIAQNLKIPFRLVNQILNELVSSGIVSEIKVGENGAVAFQPAVDPDTITIKYVIDALEHHGSSNIPVGQSKELEKLFENMEVFSDLVEKSPANQRLKEI
jgi:membrane protein